MGEVTFLFFGIMQHSQLDPLFNSAQTVMPESEIFVEHFGNNNYTLSSCPTHHNWEFEECQITNTNSLPIVPTNAWAPLQYPMQQTNTPKPTKNQFAQQLLGSWDVRIEEFIMEYIQCDQTFSNMLLDM